MEPRIAHVISTPRGFGGAERVLEALLEGGRQRGWAQTVLNPFDLDPGGSDLARLCREFGYTARATTRTWQIPAARGWLGHQLDAFSPDVVHVHLFHALVLAASLRRDAPLVLSQQHGNYLSWRGRRLRERMDALASRRCDAVVGCSRQVADFVRDSYGVESDRVRVIHNGWEGTPLPAAPASEPTVVCVANFRPEKAHDVLLTAFERVRRQMPSARLVLVGDGPGRDELEVLGRSLGISDALEFTGPVDDVWPLLASAHAFALSSRHEPLGIVVMEAMAAGLPVAAPSIGGVPELVQEGVTGFLHEPGDAIALSEALCRLLRDEGLRRRLGDEGRRRARELHVEGMVERYFDLYGEVLGASERGVRRCAESPGS